MSAEPVNEDRAKTQLSVLVDQAVAGDDVVISRAGTPMVRLVPVSARPARRTPGSARGRIRMAADFDELPDEVAAAVRGD